VSIFFRMGANDASIKVCIHDKPRVEREVTTFREQQIQAICMAFDDLQERFNLLESFHGTKESEWNKQLNALRNEMDTLRQHNMQQCARITELMSTNMQLQNDLVEKKPKSSAVIARVEVRHRGSDPEVVEGKSTTVPTTPDVRHRAHSPDRPQLLQPPPPLPATTAEARHRVTTPPDPVPPATDWRQKYSEVEHLYEALKAKCFSTEKELEVIKGDLQKQVQHNRQLVKANVAALAQLDKKDQALAAAEAAKQTSQSEVRALEQKVAALVKAMEAHDRAAHGTRKATQDSRSEGPRSPRRTEVERLERHRSRLHHEAAEQRQALEGCRRSVANLELRLAQAEAENDLLRRTRRAPSPPPPPVAVTAAAPCDPCDGFTGWSSPRKSEALRWPCDDVPTAASLTGALSRSPRVTISDPPAAASRPPPPPFGSGNVELQALRATNEALMSRLIESVHILQQRTAQ